MWEEHNSKEQILWEMGQLGGVSGDVFIKVAYEDAYVDPAGREHPGRCRIIPINPAFAFPEFHPHDRSRMIRFKLKYRFWGTALEGTRQVFTYVELITDSFIEEYINDEMISQRPNPLGVIPIVHIANRPVSSSPWGLPDIGDILSLNKEYNEKATEISDIINYHGSPLTIIKGAKMSSLERGASRVIGGLPKDADVYNLEPVGQPEVHLAFLERLKSAMHELVGVPETALGQMQPISNTSGVALSIQFQPLMNVYMLKRNQYTVGIKQINELIMLTLAQKEPWCLVFDPTSGVDLRPDQLAELDPSDPITYLSDVHWPPPLPVDILIKLNELQQLMMMGLCSKRGALRELGYENPDEILREIYDELAEDAQEQGVLNMIKAKIDAAVLEITGMMPDGTPMIASPGGSSVNNASGSADGSAPPQPTMPPADQAVVNQMVTAAYGTKLPQRSTEGQNNTGS